MTIVALAVGFAAGAAVGVAGSGWLRNRAVERSAAGRARRRAILGLSDRPPARADSQGHAIIRKANYVEGRPDSTMQM